MFLEIYVRILQGPSPASVSPTGNARWSIGRSIGRSVGWSVGRSVGWSVGRSVGRELGWLVGRSVDWSVGDRLVGWSVAWSAVGWCGNHMRPVMLVWEATVTRQQASRLPVSAGNTELECDQIRFWLSLSEVGGGCGTSVPHPIVA